MMNIESPRTIIRVSRKGKEKICRFTGLVVQTGVQARWRKGLQEPSIRHDSLTAGKQIAQGAAAAELFNSSLGADL